MATVTPNFNWPVPTSTDLVKDGATAIEALGDSIDASLVDLKGGTTGQVLSKNSNTDMDFTWVTDAAGDITGVTAGTGISGGGTSGTVTVTNSMATAIDAKGDLIAGTAADTFARLAVGTNGQVLVADSAEATGLKWATAASSSGPAFQAFTSTSFSAATVTYVKIQLNSETFDTDNCFDSTTNYRFTPNKAGYYQFNSRISIGGMAANAQAYGALAKNGTNVALQGSGARDTTFNYGVTAGSALIYLNGSTDYVELYVYVQQAAGTVPINADALGFETALSGVWIRS